MKLTFVRALSGMVHVHDTGSAPFPSRQFFNEPSLRWFARRFVNLEEHSNLQDILRSQVCEIYIELSYLAGTCCGSEVPQPLLVLGSGSRRCIRAVNACMFCDPKVRTFRGP